jgi:hypothetical protein
MALDPTPQELATAQAAKRALEQSMTEAATRFEQETGFTIDHVGFQRVHRLGAGPGPACVIVTVDARREIVL